MSSLPVPALELFERQHGVAQRQQLLAWMTPPEVSGHLARGSLRRLQRGVYRPAGAAVTPEARALAAVLRCPEGARLTGPFALAAHGVEGFAPGAPFEVLVPPGRRPTNVPFPIREDPEPDEPSIVRRALPLVRIDRCLIDSARPLFRLEVPRLYAALDSARWQGLTTTEDFRAAVADSSPRDKGARAWRRLGFGNRLVVESPKERLLLRWLSAFDPPPEPQVWVTPRRRVDFFWREPRLALEYQGRRSHAHAGARDRDASREDELAKVGIMVLPVVAEDLADRDTFLAWIERVLTERARQLDVPAPTLTRKLREDTASGV